jgi:hypothetical protein
MTMQKVLVRKADIFAADMDGSTVMMNMETGMYYNLGEVGSRIWELLEQPIRVADLIEALTGEFDVDFDRCAKDTIPFLQRLLENKLILEAGE